MATIDPARFSYVMDPADRAPFAFVLQRGDGANDTIGEDEAATSFTITPTPAAISAGLRLGTGSRAPVLEGNVIGFWADFDPSANSSPAFDAPGTEMGVEATVNLDSGRILQRTGYIRAGQR